MLKDGTQEFFSINPDSGNNLDEPDMIIYDFQIKCTFKNKFVLQNFPFDCQGIYLFIFIFIFISD